MDPRSEYSSHQTSPPPSTTAYSDHPDSQGPIPVDTEQKSYPEVVPGSHVVHGIPAYSHQHQWQGEQQSPVPQKRKVSRGVVITAAIAIIIIAVLAGILGGVASGSIKTGATRDQNNPADATKTVTVTAGSGTTTGSPATSTPSPSTTTISTSAGDVVVECPSADGLNYTAPGGSRVFRRQCNVNYFGGEGSLGLQKATVLSMEDCLNRCAISATCVGVTFNYKPQCWMKEYIGIKSTGDGQESAVLWQ